MWCCDLFEKDNCPLKHVFKWNVGGRLHSISTDLLKTTKHYVLFDDNVTYFDLRMIWSNDVVVDADSRILR